MAIPDIPSIQTIKTRIESDIQSKINQTIPNFPVSFVKVLSFAVAGPVFLLYVSLIWVYKQIFPSTSDYENLLKHGDLVDVPFDEATFAEITGNLDGTGASVPVDVVYRGTNQITYRVTAETPIVNGLAVNVPMKALSSGTAGNIADGEALVLQGSAPGLDGSGVVSGTTSSGSNKQSRDSYKNDVETRYKTKFIYGSPAGYAISGLEAPNFIWVGPYADPELPGNTIIYGRVDLSLATDGVPTQDQLNELEQFCRFDPETGLEVRRPINDTIDAIAIANREFDITINIIGAIQSVKDSIEVAVADYLQTLEPYIEGVSLGIKNALTNTDVTIVADDIATSNGAKVTSVTIVDVLNLSIESNYILFGGEFAISRNISFADVT